MDHNSLTLNVDATNLNIVLATPIEALYRHPRTTKPEPGHQIYPYLLRGMEITRPNQVWAMDITYIPMARATEMKLAAAMQAAAMILWISLIVMFSALPSLTNLSSRLTSGHPPHKGNEMSSVGHSIPKRDVSTKSGWPQ
jgi:hypothetical protein